MSPPPILGPVGEPHASDYAPRPVPKGAIATSIAATQELLDWMRFRGYGAQSVTVGPAGVQIVGLVDLYARQSRRPSPPDPNAPEGW